MNHHARRAKRASSSHSQSSHSCPRHFVSCEAPWQRAGLCSPSPDVGALREYSCASANADGYYDGAIHLAVSPSGRVGDLLPKAPIKALRHGYAHHVLVSNGRPRPAARARQPRSARAPRREVRAVRTRCVECEMSAAGRFYVHEPAYDATVVVHVDAGWRYGRRLRCNPCARNEVLPTSQEAHSAALRALNVAGVIGCRCSSSE